MIVQVRDAIGGIAVLLEYCTRRDELLRREKVRFGPISNLRCWMLDVRCRNLKSELNLSSVMAVEQAEHTCSNRSRKNDRNEQLPGHLPHYEVELDLSVDGLAVQAPGPPE